MASTLEHFSESSSRYYSHEFCEPSIFKNDSAFGALQNEKTLFDAASIYFTLEHETG